jgi:hypothetical protein
MSHKLGDVWKDYSYPKLPWKVQLPKGIHSTKTKQEALKWASALEKRKEQKKEQLDPIRKFKAEVIYSIVEGMTRSDGTKTYSTIIKIVVNNRVIQSSTYSSGHRSWEVEKIFKDVSKKFENGTFGEDN